MSTMLLKTKFTQFMNTEERLQFFVRNVNVQKKENVHSNTFFSLLRLEDNKRIDNEQDIVIFIDSFYKDLYSSKDFFFLRQNLTNSPMTLNFPPPQKKTKKNNNNNNEKETTDRLLAFKECKQVSKKL